jgi:hypothetical protein
MSPAASARRSRPRLLARLDDAGAVAVDQAHVEADIATPGLPACSHRRDALATLRIGQPLSVCQ